MKFAVVLFFASLVAVMAQPKSADPDSKWLKWIRPVDNPVFSTTMGNNHDSVLFVDHELNLHPLLPGTMRGVRTLGLKKQFPSSCTPSYPGRCEVSGRWG